MDKAKLEARLNELEQMLKQASAALNEAQQAVKQAEANGNAILGAIEENQRWLAQLETESKVKNDKSS